MSGEPLVSVITLAYNHGRYIGQCLDGLVMQKTDFPFEVIIHDDASTDNTAEIIREYESRYPDIIKPVYQTENQYSKGVSIGATYLYPKARGRYIAECEGDDWWTDPFKLQKQVDFLESHPAYSMCCTGYSSYRMRDGLVRPGSGKAFDITMRRLMKKNPIGTLTVMFRKGLLDEYQRDLLPEMPGFRIGDIPLWIFMASKGKVRKLADVTAMYRILDSSLSHSDDFSRQYEFILECSRIRLWMNSFLGLHYSFFLKRRAFSGSIRFCRRWARTHGGGRPVSYSQIYKTIKSL